MDVGSATQSTPPPVTSSTAQQSARLETQPQREAQTQAELESPPPPPSSNERVGTVINTKV